MCPCPVWSPLGSAIGLLFYNRSSIPRGFPFSWQRMGHKASFMRMIYRHIATADPQMLLLLSGNWVKLWTGWRHRHLYVYRSIAYV